MIFKRSYCLKISLGILFLFGTLKSIAQASPGNVNSNLQLWIRADQGVALTGTDVDSWTDQSINGFVGASEGSSDAEYVIEGLNFNPVLRFTDNQFYNYGAPTELDINPDSEEMTIITMVVTGGATTGTVISKANNNGTRNYQVWFGSTDRVLHHTMGRQGWTNQAVRWGTIYALNEPKITTGIVADTGDPLTRLSPYVNGVLDPADRNDGTFTGGDSSVDVLVGARRNGGNSGSGYRYDGDIAEIIIYDRDLNALEQQKVESYLAIKYGVTLGSNDAYWDTPSNTSSPFGYTGTSNDYVASDNTILWNGTDNAGFGHNIIGVARDNDSNLLQEKSKSVNVVPEPILTLEAEAGTLSSNLSYILTGSNGNNVALSTAGLPVRIINTLERIWKVRESANNQGSVALQFDLSTSPISDAQASNLELIIADNLSFNNYKNTTGTYNAATNILTFTGINFEDADYFTLATVEELNDSYHFNFTGTNQYLDLSDHNDLTGSFTISSWINSNTNNSTIVSKGGTSGYELLINGSGHLEMNWQNSVTQSITSTNPVPLNIWHHIAVIYDGTTARIYIDGVADGSANISFSPVNNSDAFLIGASGSAPSNFFSGEMDELRIWNRALTLNQLRFIINQEIEDSGGRVYGKIIPQTTTKHDTNTIPWNDLIAYYPYSHVRGNCLFNESLNTTQNARLYNTPAAAIELQTTPLPFISNTHTDWDIATTWTNGNVQYIPNATINGTSVDWNIVDINHNISVNRDLTVLGLISNSNELEVNGTTGADGTGTGHGLTVTHYLKLDGIIDLEGESQLIQTDGSDLDVNSLGSLERDQQGSKDLYTYNYWSSPVGSSISGTNNNAFNLSNNILKNGTVAASPNNITFLNTGYDGSVLGTNISIAEYWIWKYANATSNTYALWQFVGSLNDISVGEGFTMKGVESSGTSFTSKQNYVFDGKPNNGDITLPIFSGSDYLVGNPYPSAIDANEFIYDNISDGLGRAPSNIINGVLYFWDHFANNTHILREYEGGYATYTLIGAVSAISNDTRINASLAGGTLIPQQHIPVGQGFFVSTDLDASLTGIATITGGDITFKNSQRAFVTEAAASSLFFKNSNTKNTQKPSDLRPKIRLSFTSPKGYHRQLLVGVDEHASNNFDVGYDAPLIEDNMEDIFWYFNNHHFVIQGVNNLDSGQILPIGIKTAEGGLITIKIDELENIASDLNVYLHDKDLNIYHDLKANNYETHLTSGTYSNRYEITFSKPQDGLGTENLNNQIEVYFFNEKKNIVINNPDLKLIESAEVINIIGQTLFKFQINADDNNMEFNVNTIQTGSYILKIKTESGIISKKVLIK